MSQKRFWVFTLQAAVASVLLLIAGFIDRYTNSASIVTTVVKIGFCIVMIIYFSRHEDLLKTDKRSGSKNIWLQFILLAILNVIPSFRILDSLPTWDTVVLYVFILAVSCLWDELFFRLYASVFALKGKGALKDLFAVSAVYALSKLVDLPASDYLSVAITVLFSFGFGCLLITMYRRRRHIWFGFFLHFVLNLTNLIFALFSTHECWVGLWALPIYLFLSVFCIFLADLNLNEKFKNKHKS